MALALLGEPNADVEDVGLLGVAPGHLAERLRQGLLPLVDQPDVGREVHRGQPSLLAGADAVLSGAGDAPFPRETRVTTAPPLKAGCFDTGSQAVMVSSFAARRTAVAVGVTVVEGDEDGPGPDVAHPGLRLDGTARRLHPHEVALGDPERRPSGEISTPTRRAAAFSSDARPVLVRVWK